LPPVFLGIRARGGRPPAIVAPAIPSRRARPGRNFAADVSARPGVAGRWARSYTSALLKPAADPTSDMGSLATRRIAPRGEKTGNWLGSGIVSRIGKIKRL